MKNLNPATQQPYKVLWFGDGVGLSGFGRIGNEVCKRLSQRGYIVQMAVINYTGWPHNLPVNWIWPLAGQDIWGAFTAAANTFQPDIIISCQDFPYHQTIWHACRIDFSRIKWVWITPIDGTPIHPDWLKICDVADGGMVISRFGVEALRQEGKRAALCHPGVDRAEFYPATGEEAAALRGKAGYTVDDFIVGVMCMNQGRKAISQMIAGFHEFARDKPNARLLLDMDKVSPAGWDIPNLLKQMRWTEAEQTRVKYREDLFKADMAAFAPLRNRYAMLDLHMVISHREGFGLPLLESMACGIPAMALDWCSGTEIAGGVSAGSPTGFLVKRLPYMEHGTWGGARDAFPDMADFIAQLNRAYAQPEQTAAIAKRGYEWAITNTWDVTTDQVEETMQAALGRPRKERPAHAISDAIPAVLSDTHGRNGDRPDVAAPAPISNHPVIQQPGSVDTVPEVVGGDGGGTRESGPA